MPWPRRTGRQSTEEPRWLDRNREVDFLLVAGDVVTAIEVKSGTRKTSLHAAQQRHAADQLRETLLQLLLVVVRGALLDPHADDLDATLDLGGLADQYGTGRKTLIIAGVWTSVCVTFPALQAHAEGYKEYAVMDASGDPSEMASRITLARLSQAGVVPMSTNMVFCELQRTWNRPDAAAFAALYSAYAPNYRAAIESFQRAQDVIKREKK